MTASSPRGRPQRKQVLLRLDPSVYEALARWANDELRSANAQIEFLLRRALSESGRLPGDTPPIPRRGRPPRAAGGPGTPGGPGAPGGRGDSEGGPRPPSP
ncbi:MULTISPECIES: hypothetical protein [Streptomyces]|uniref:Toxin-antitoxin system HicB family antitoxin n=1 Tax=Streptomyces edwardsiae TaxID=3075527 RepID=A0ABU2Q836_9ACTN|nr:MULTISPECIES: hypothetical protein [unclassified Streptomyces]MDT0400602.1 hypothetical protein [Streptomyces sp. DSM 41635]